MRKLKVLGVLFAILMVFGITTVNAASMSSSDSKLLKKISDGAAEKARTMIEDIKVTTSVASDGKTVTIKLTSEQMADTMGNLSFKVTLKNNIVTYNAQDVENIELVFPYVLAAIIDNAEGKSTTTSDDATGVIESISNYSFSENGIEGTYSGGVLTYLKVDAAKMKLAGGYTSSSSSSSSSSSTTTTTTTTENPKTGVFVPVIGLSVLIVASVVCLIWISKKNVFKGF